MIIWVYWCSLPGELLSFIPWYFQNWLVQPWFPLLEVYNKHPFSFHRGGSPLWTHDLRAWKQWWRVDGAIDDDVDDDVDDVDDDVDDDDDDDDVDDDDDDDYDKQDDYEYHDLEEEHFIGTGNVA